MAKEYKKAVIYCRVSSEKQVKEGNGLDSQEHRCREYAVSLGLEVESVFRDEGISGGLFDRPAMKLLIEYLDDNWQNKYVVIFDDLKRFARDVEVHIKIKSELKVREAQLKCLNYNFDNSAEGEFVETIFAAQNELERKQNKRQVCQKMKARIERGYWCFCPPTGYEYIKDDNHGKLLTPIRKITDILSQGITDFAEDRLVGQVDLMRFFTSKNLHIILGKKKIHFEFTKRILTELIYAGFIEYSEWGVPRRSGHHKAIISKKIYEKVQVKLLKPERKPRESDNIEFPLRRIVNCAVCGKKMTGSSNRSKNPNKYYPHYTCNNKECSASPKNITKSKVEKEYFEMLQNIKVEKEIIEMAAVIVPRLWQQKINDMEVNKTATEKEIKDIEKQIEQFIDLIPSTRSESVKTRVETKIDALDQQVIELKRGLKNKKEPCLNEAISLTKRFLGTPAVTWKKSDREKKMMVHNMIFEENPEYSANNGFGTPKLTLPFYIKHYVMGQVNTLVEVAGVAPASKW